MTARQAPYRENRITLAAVPNAVSCSRWYTRLMFQQWGLGALVETAELLASELVTNAVRATGLMNAEVDLTELRGVNLIRIQLTAYQDSAFISVWDTDPTPPILQEGSLDAESGRGLVLVSTLSRRWSFYPSPRGGKVVWCEVENLPLTAAGLPRRTPQRWSPRPADLIRDRSMLLRVRDGLLAL